jgi:hypothetical protein
VLLKLHSRLQEVSMPLFSRSLGSFQATLDHLRYRTEIREDFLRRCHYCLMPEPIYDESLFTIDHFKPKVLFQSLLEANDFLNLYYACSGCNKIKWKHWPSPSLIEKGIGFVNLCVDDWSTHFILRDDATLQPLTKSAVYTIERCRLNHESRVKQRRWMLDNGYGELPLWNT